MPHDIPASRVGGAKDTVQNPATTPPDKRLFNSAELRLFRYTAVLFTLVALTALIVISVWAFGWILNTFYNLLLTLALPVFWLWCCILWWRGRHWLVYHSWYFFPVAVVGYR